MNKKEARRYSFEPHSIRSAIISISDKYAIPNNFNLNNSNGVISVCQVFFDDVDKNDVNSITSDDAQKIVKFVKWCQSHDIEKIIVHCNAGVSRSAGVCAALEKVILGDDMDIFSSGNYVPNMTCYRAILDAWEYPYTYEECVKKENYNLKKWLDIFNEKY